MIKIKRFFISNNNILYKAYFKNDYEFNKLKDYLYSLDNIVIISLTFVDNKGYYEYYYKEEI